MRSCRRQAADRAAEPGDEGSTALPNPIRVFADPAWLDRVAAACREVPRQTLALPGAGNGRIGVPVVRDLFRLPGGEALGGWRVGAVHYTDYLDFPNLEAFGEQGLHGLLDAARTAGCAFVLFSHVPRGGSLGRLLHGTARRDGDWHTLACQPALGVDATMGSGAWWASRGRESRRRLERYHRKALEAGGVFAIGPATEEALEILLDLQARRSEQAGLDCFAAMPDFAALIRSLAGSGLARVATLRLEDDCAGILLLLGDGDATGIYAQAFAPRWRHLSPGTGLFVHVIEDAFRRGLRYVDFLRGDEPYKRHMATTTVEMDKHLWLAPDAPPGALAFFEGLIE